MFKDVHSAMALIDVYGPISAAADNTPAAIDLKGYNAAEILLGIGIGGITFDDTNKLVFELGHSDDNVTYVAVTDADMLGVTGIVAGTTGFGVIKSLVVAHAAANNYRFGYRGGKRYLKWLNNFSGTHGTATPLHVLVAAMHAAVQPVAADA